MRVKKDFFCAALFGRAESFLLDNAARGDVAFEEGDDGLAGLDPGQEHALGFDAADDGRLEVGDDRDRYPEMRHGAFQEDISEFKIAYFLGALIQFTKFNAKNIALSPLISPRAAKNIFGLK